MFKARWCCPITMLEANGKNRFFAMRPCGCVLSERALKEVPSTTCLHCGKPIKADASILLAPSKEEFDELRVKMEQRIKEHKETERKDKKEKKEKRRVEAGEDGITKEN